jgi:autotransporter-associated beta strand protein
MDVKCNASPNFNNVMKHYPALIFSVLLMIPFVLSGQTWTGDDPDDNNWSSDDNWGGGNAPEAGNAVTLPGSVTPGVTNFDLDGLRLNTLTLNAIASQGWTIAGDNQLLRITQDGVTSVLNSGGAATNLIGTNVQFVNANGDPATGSGSFTVNSGNILRATGDWETFQLRMLGTGEFWLSGALTITRADSNDTNAGGIYLRDGGTFRFTGSTYTNNDNIIRVDNGSTVIWDSSAALTKLVAGAGGGHFVTAQDITKVGTLATGENDRFQFGAGSNGIIGFSALGETRSLSFLQLNGNPMLWTRDFSGSGSNIQSAVIELNTHAEADAQVVWTSALNVRDAGVEAVKTLRVGNVSGLSVDAVFSGVIGNQGNVNAHFGALRKDGAGTLLLTGNNTHSGTWEIAAGTLLIGGSTSGQGTHTVLNGATLGGTGTLGLREHMSVVLENGAFLAPGRPDLNNGAGVFTISTSGDGVLDISAVAGQGYGALRFDLAEVGSSDRVVLSGGALHIGTGQLEWADFSFNTLAGFGQGTYTLLELQNGATLVGSFGDTLTGSIGAFTGTLSFDMNDNLMLVVIPEPGQVGLVLSLVVGLLAVLRRRVGSQKR